MNPGSGDILLIEDNVTIRETLKMALEMEGYSVREAGDGNEALLQLEKRPLPDLIILDLLLPNMNGFEFLGEIKKDAKNSVAKIPVIVLSAVAGVSKKELFQAQEVFSKPVDLDKLFGAVRKVSGLAG